MRAITVFLVVFAAACSGSAPADDPSADDNTSDSQDKLLAGRRLSESEVVSVLRAAGFPEHAIAPMVCTAKYESSFYDHASHKNRDGSIDRGLFQVNSTHVGDSGCPRTGDGLYDPKTNARCARVIYDDQGLRAWYGYQKHRSECDSYALGGD